MKREELEVQTIIDAPTTTQAQIVKGISSGQWGVAIRGTRFVVPLPKGFTEHTQLCDFFGAVIAAHPGVQPHLIDAEHGRAIPVDFDRMKREMDAPISFSDRIIH